MQQDYVLLAKAKGLRNAHILFRHVLKPSSFTLITVAGLTIGTLIGGALVVETICASWRRPLADRLDKQSGDRLVEPISQEALIKRTQHSAMLQRTYSIRLSRAAKQKFDAIEQIEVRD
jgi:hypothetical protein